MTFIRLLLDRHYPYDISAFDYEVFSVKKVALKPFLFTGLSRLDHIITLYKQSFTTDVVLGNRRTALLLGLLFYFYKPPQLNLVGYEIIFAPQNGLRKKLVTLFWRIAIINIDQLVVQSEEERHELAKRFNCSLDKITFIPFYTENAEFFGASPGGYIFSAGRMERDYETLLKAVSHTNAKLIIVADISYRPVLNSYRSPNIEIYYNISRLEYLKLLKGAKIVAICLKKGSSSRGQVVALEAIKYGKPVIASKAGGMHHYVKHGESGWLVEAENEKELHSLLKTHFDDQEKLNEVGRKAFEQQRKKFSPESFQKNYHKLIIKLCRKKHPPQHLTVLSTRISKE